MSSFKDFLWEYPQNLPKILYNTGYFIRRFRPLSYIVILSLLSFGAYYFSLKYNALNTVLSYEKEQENVLVLGMVANDNSINAISPPLDAQKYFNSLIYNKLVYIEPDESINPELVKSWEITPDGIVYTLHLRKDVKWHNGSDFDASDIVYSYSLYQNQKKLNLPLKTKINIIDPFTIQIILPSIDVTFWEDMNINIVPSPHHLLKSSATIGTGPYILDSISRNVTILKANPNYFFGKPKIDKIKVITYQSESDLKDALSRYDLTMAIMPDKNIFNIYNYTNESFDITTQYTGIFFNTKSEGIQKDNNNRKILYDSLSSLEELKSPISKYSWAYSPIEEVPSTSLKLSGPITLTYLNTPYFSDIAQKVSQKWISIGLTVIKDPEDSASLGRKIGERSYEALLTTVEIGIDPDQSRYWYSNQIFPQGLNLSDYSNSRVDQFLNLARLTLNINTRKSAYFLMQKDLSLSYAAAYLLNPTLDVMYYKSLKGVSTGSLPFSRDIFNNIQNWQIRNS